MLSATQQSAIDSLVSRYKKVNLYEMDLSSGAAMLLIHDTTELLVEMALQFHPAFEFIYENWITEVDLLTFIKDDASSDQNKRQTLHSGFLATLLAFGDADEQTVDEYRSQIAGDVSPSAGAMNCIVCVIDNDPQTAIQQYWSTAMHPANKSKHQIVGGLPALFYALAVLKTKEAAAAAESLEAFLQAYRASLPNDRFVSVVGILFHYSVARAEQAGLDEFGGNDQTIAGNCPWRVLFQCLCLHWLGEKPTPRLVDRLRDYAHEANAAGVHWYLTQANQLLMRFGEAPVYNEYLDEPGWLVDLMEPANHWLTRLQQIETISERYSGLSNSNEGDHRLIWLCHEHDQIIEITARLQKRSKKGDWTKGRKVSIQDMLWTGQNQQYLNPEERKFFKALKYQTSDGYGYFYRQQKTTLDSLELIESFATLGNMYRIDEYDNISAVPMKIELQDPHLEVLQQLGEDHITIQLKPAPVSARAYFFEEENPWHLQWISDDTLQVTRYTEGQKEIAKVLGVNGVPIPAQAKDRVLDSLNMMAPMITVLSDIGGADTPDLLEVEPNSTPHMELSPLQDGLRAELKIYPFGRLGPSVAPGQSGSTMLATIDDEPRKTTRDIALEQQRVEPLTHSAPLVDLPESDTRYCWEIEDPAQSLELLDMLQGFGNDIEIDWPKGQRITIPHRVSSSNMSVRVGGSDDWLQIDGELQVSEDRVLQMDALLRLLDGANGRFVKLDDGSILALSKRLKSQLTALRSVSDDGKVHPLASAVIDDSTADMNITGSEVWRDRLKRLQEAASLEPELPAGLNAQLRDYQLEGFEWLTRLAHWGAGACLADDMGLGKTLQSLAVVLQRASLGPTLIVAPTSVCSNWEVEIERFAPSLIVLRMDSGDRRQIIKSCAAGDVLISSYGLLQNEIAKLAEVQWATIVADEAQAFKNSQTRRSKAMMLLNADFRIITTGTPIENHLGELWNLFRFINPGLLGSRERFNERFAYPIEVRSEEQARLQLKALVQPFILRRLKSDVLTELPPRTEITQLIEFTAQETAFYEAIRRQSIERISAMETESNQRFRILAEITRLRQVCCNPRLVVDNPPVESAKLRVFAEIVGELRENGHRCLVFSQFVGHLSLVREYLDKEGITYQYLDGSTPVKKRKKAVDSFQGGDGVLFLISLKAGGSGLNLTAADYVIHMDPWWNPAVEDQASDRAHRMGQKRPVTIYRLVVKDTIEEKIVALHAQKRDLADGLLEGTDSGARLSADDLMQLLNSDSAG